MERLMLECERCSGQMQLQEDGLRAKCPYCNHEIVYKQPKSDALTQALNRANKLRFESRFADAIREYKLVVEENPNDAQALWGLVLSEYGIEYVKDPRTHRFIPTCHRALRGSIFENKHYRQAWEAATDEQREDYEGQAKDIDRLQKEILRRTELAEDYDIFISFKSTDERGMPTRDARIARVIYDELKKRGFKTFFSDVTLNEMLFADYEPIIFRALYSCKFFILVATSDEFVNAPWVKNEWSRFEERMAEERLSGVACAVFDGASVSTSTLPPFLRTQGIDLRRHSAGGYEVLLADSIERKLGRSKKSREEEEILRQIEEQKRQQSALEERLRALQTNPGGGMSGGGASATVRSLLIRAQQELEMRSFDRAAQFYERVLEMAPDNVDVWWGLFLCDFKATDEEEILDNLSEELLEQIEGNRNYQIAFRYITEESRSRLEHFRSELRNPDNWWTAFLRRMGVESEQDLYDNLNLDTYHQIHENSTYRKVVEYADDGFRFFLEGFERGLKQPRIWWNLFLKDCECETAEELLEKVTADALETYTQNENYLFVKENLQEFEDDEVRTWLRKIYDKVQNELLPTLVEEAEKQAHKIQNATAEINKQKQTIEKQIEDKNREIDGLNRKEKDLTKTYKRKGVRGKGSRFRRTFLLLILAWILVLVALYIPLSLIGDFFPASWPDRLFTKLPEWLVWAPIEVGKLTQLDTVTNYFAYLLILAEAVAYALVLAIILLPLLAVAASRQAKKRRRMYDRIVMLQQEQRNLSGDNAKKMLRIKDIEDRFDERYQLEEEKRQAILEEIERCRAYLETENVWENTKEAELMPEPAEEAIPESFETRSEAERLNDGAEAWTDLEAPAYEEAAVSADETEEK